MREREIERLRRERERERERRERGRGRGAELPFIQFLVGVVVCDLHVCNIPQTCLIA